ELGALGGRGLALKDLQHFEEAAAAFEQALAAKPDDPYAFNGVLECALTMCSWARAERLISELPSRIIERRAAASPFTLLGASDDAMLHFHCAQNFTRDTLGLAPRPLCEGERWRHDRIRIAYLSADFHEHATAYLIAQLIELHDKTRFEITAVSFGPEGGGPMRARLQLGTDRFIDVRPMSDADVAALMADCEIDIAVA